MDFLRDVVQTAEPTQRFFVGLDMSVRSPGICWQIGKTVGLYGFAQLKREEGYKHTYNEEERIVHIHLFPRLPTDRWATQMHIATIFEEMISILISRAHLVKVAIEGYAYQEHSSSVTKLAEMGGIIRYLLRKYQVDWQEIPPTQIKRCMTGKGTASKSAMVDALHTHLPFCDTDLGLGCKPEHSPLNDLADAYAVMLCGLQSSTTLSLSPPKKKKRKLHVLPSLDSDDTKGL